MTVAVFPPAKACAKLLRRLIAVAAALGCALGAYAGQARFSGRVVLELLDEAAFAHQMRLLEDFAFTDQAGKQWLVRKGAIVDGESIPRALSGLDELPYPADYRKSAVMHDYFCRSRTDSWRQVHRALFEASLAEGLSESEAKRVYAAVYAGGWRWEPKGSTCYRSCHAAATSLAWRPAVTPEEIQPVLHWIAQSEPGLDAIDARLDAAIRKPGPHVFAQR